MITYTLKEDFTLIRAVTGNQEKIQAGTEFNLVSNSGTFSLLRKCSEGKDGGLFAVSSGCLKDNFKWDIKNEDIEH
jgi:hypothetical protein